MLGWLYRMIVGRFTSCSHQWAILQKINIFEGGSRPVQTDYQLCCEKCGILKYQKGE